jgi:biopolymer transport protein ExbD
MLWIYPGKASHSETTHMSEINIPQLNNRRAGVARMKRHNLKIDMTPMVDLGFLLISFFVITVEMSKPSATDLIMPKDGKGTELQKSAALTVLLGEENDIWYYHGDWREAVQQKEIHQTSFSYSSGLDEIIREKQKLLDNSAGVHDGRDGLTILIKAADNANYEGVVDVLDEIIINNVKRYALVTMTKEEKEFLIKTKSY